MISVVCAPRSNTMQLINGPRLVQAVFLNPVTCNPEWLKVIVNMHQPIALERAIERGIAGESFSASSQSHREGRFERQHYFASTSRNA